MLTGDALVQTTSIGAVDSTALRLNPSLVYPTTFCETVGHSLSKLLTLHVYRKLSQSGSGLASYPGLLAPVFVACSTNTGEGLVKLSHVV